MRRDCAIRRRLLLVLLVISALGQCGLPLLLESGHSTKTDLRIPADFQRFTAPNATARNCRFPFARLSEAAEGATGRESTAAGPCRDRCRKGRLLDGEPPGPSELNRGSSDWGGFGLGAKRSVGFREVPEMVRVWQAEPGEKTRTRQVNNSKCSVAVGHPSIVWHRRFSPHRRRNLQR